MLAVIAARSAPAGSESAEPDPERPRRRSRARSSRRHRPLGPAPPSRPDAGRTQTGWRELGPGRGEPGPGYRRRAGRRPSREDPLLFRGAAGRRRLLSALPAGASGPGGAVVSALPGAVPPAGPRAGPWEVRRCPGSGAGPGGGTPNQAPKTGAGDRDEGRGPSGAAPSVQEGDQVLRGEARLFLPPGPR